MEGSQSFRCLCFMKIKRAFFSCLFYLFIYFFFFFLGGGEWGRGGEGGREGIASKPFTQCIILVAFFVICFFFFFFFCKTNFFGKFFQDVKQLNLDLDQAQHYVEPDLGPNCSQRLSADDKVATSR